MAKQDRIENSVLLQAGLELMRQNDKPLTKLPSRGRSMLYELPGGESVRIRTCNDHVLIAVADQPGENARLNLEGTDWLLVVMPEVERTEGDVIGYLVPTCEAVEEVREAHRAWLASNPRTKGSNTTWNIWFDRGGPGKSSGFAEKWAEYRLEGSVSTIEVAGEQASQSGDAAGNMKAEVEAARNRIANVAGVSPEAVKISIEFAG